MQHGESTDVSQQGISTFPARVYFTPAVPSTRPGLAGGTVRGEKNNYSARGSVSESVASSVEVSQAASVTQYARIVGNCHKDDTSREGG